MFRYVALLGLCVAASPASAEELVALQGDSIELGAFHGTVYYTTADDGYRVVTTMASGDEGLPVRFATTLVEGQRLEISVPGKVGEPGTVLGIMRIDGKLVVERVGETPKAASLAE